MFLILIFLALFGSCLTKEYNRYSCGISNKVEQSLIAKQLTEIKICNKDFLTSDKVYCVKNTPTKIDYLKNYYDGCDNIIYFDNLEHPLESHILIVILSNALIFILIAISLGSVFPILDEDGITEESRCLVVMAVSLLTNTLINIMLRCNRGVYSYYMITIIIHLSLMLFMITIDLLVALCRYYEEEKVYAKKAFTEIYIYIFNLLIFLEFPILLHKDNFSNIFADVLINIQYLNPTQAGFIYLINLLLVIWLGVKAYYKSHPIYMLYHIFYILIINSVLISSLVTSSVYVLFIMILFHKIFLWLDYKRCLTRVMFSLVNNLTFLFVLYNSTNSILNDNIIILIISIIPVIDNFISMILGFKFNNIYLVNLINILTCYGIANVILNNINLILNYHIIHSDKILLIGALFIYELFLKLLLFQYNFSKTWYLMEVWSILTLINYTTCLNIVILPYIPYFWLGYNIMLYIIPILYDKFIFCMVHIVCTVSICLFIFLSLYASVIAYNIIIVFCSLAICIFSMIFLCTYGLVNNFNNNEEMTIFCSSIAICIVTNVLAFILMMFFGVYYNEIVKYFFVIITLSFIVIYDVISIFKIIIDTEPSPDEYTTEIEDEKFIVYFPKRWGRTIKIILSKKCSTLISIKILRDGPVDDLEQDTRGPPEYNTVLTIDNSAPPAYENVVTSEI